MLYSRSLFFILYIYLYIYLSIHPSFYLSYCISVNPKLLIYPPPNLSPLITISLFSMSVGLLDSLYQCYQGNTHCLGKGKCLYIAVSNQCDERFVSSNFLWEKEKKKNIVPKTTYSYVKTRERTHKCNRANPAHYKLRWKRKHIDNAERPALGITGAPLVISEFLSF